MNKLLKFGRKDTTAAIIDLPLSAQAERHILDIYTGMVSTITPVPERLLARIAARPRLAADLINAELLSHSYIEKTVTNATIAMNIVSHRPSLYPIFSDLILGTPETAEQLFYLIASGRDIDGNEYRVNLPVTTEDILERLEDDPRRRLDILLVQNPERAETEIALARKTAEARKHDSAGWAFYWLTNNSVPTDFPLDPALVSALSASEDYSYLTMKVLRNRLCTQNVWAPLEAAIKTPRWAYHVLIDGLAHAHRERLDNLLLTDPGWLVEYMNEAKIDGEDRRKCYLNCVEVACDHPLLPDLHYWYRLTSLVRKSL